ncbi:MAG TPA: hypothetical protein VKB67_02065 [Rhizomicrobium sp.]|nr:hypothetical protein [Rhizomicrobium sp.]
MAITVAVLRAAGLTPEQIVAVLEAEENQSREKARLRVAAYRKRKAEEKLPVDPLSDQIPQGWRPDMSVLMLADEKGLTKEQTNLEIERFRDYMLARGQRRSDWNAACRSWFNSPLFAQGISNGKPREHYLSQWDRAFEKLENFTRRSGANGADVAAPVQAESGGRSGSVSHGNYDRDEPLPF